VLFAKPTFQTELSMGQQLQVTVRWANFASQKLCFITGCAPPLVASSCAIS